MKYYGNTGTTYKQMQSYLNGRYQRTNIKGKYLNTSFSSWDLTKHGVPQVSVLGPLMFLTYINDLRKTLNEIATSVILADEMSVIIANKI
jgi:hypothetical protein